MNGRLLRCAAALALLAGLAALPDASTAGDKDKEPVTGKVLDKQFEQGAVKFDYLLYLPPGYGKGEKSWPVVLFLHGLGDQIARQKRTGLPRQMEKKQESRFILVTPQNPVKGRWVARDVNVLLDDVVAKHKVDKDRVYVTGLSMGGYGTWSLLAAYPDKFAAAIPICGGGAPTTAKKFKEVPIWVFHGEDDTTVKIAQSEAMVKALKDAGSTNVKFTRYPKTGHDSWTKTYSNAEVWDWMLAQKRGAAKKADSPTETKDQSDPMK
jgi:predicted peptidase